MDKGPIYEKSKSLSISIIRLADILFEEHLFSLSNQILRSGTSIGANIREGYRAQSIPDFISKMNIALKEAEETAYWLEILFEADKINLETYKTYYLATEEIIKLLVSIINTTKKKNQFWSLKEKETNPIKECTQSFPKCQLIYCNNRVEEKMSRWLVGTKLLTL